MGADIKETYGGLGKANYVIMDPCSILIVGLDVPIPKDPNDPLCALRDPNPERMAQPVSELEASMAAFGWEKGSAVPIKKIGEKVYAADGRRRIRAARLVNQKIQKAGGDAFLRIPCIPSTSASTAMAAVVLNSGRLEETPLGRAKTIAYLQSLNYDDASIIAAMGLTKTTFENLKALLNLTPDMKNEIETGKIAPSVGYDLGKLPQEKQAKSLAAVREATGSQRVTGARGRANIQAAGAGRKLSITPGLKIGQMKNLRALLEPTDEEPYEDTAQELTYLLLGIILGEDETKSAASLKDFPNVQKYVAKVMKVAK